MAAPFLHEWVGMRNHSTLRIAILTTLLACLCAPAPAADTGRRAAPAYAPSGVVNGASYLSGGLAPYTLATIFGSELAFVGAAWESVSPTNQMPVELSGVTVTMNGMAVPLYFVSPSQINLMIPGAVAPGDVKLRVTRQGVPGPDITVRVEECAPELFRTQGGPLVAAHLDGSPATQEAPARPGEVVVLYATGLGRTLVDLPNRMLPTLAAPIVRLSEFRLTFDGVEVARERILYVGVTPGFGGLYQINVRLPDGLGNDPETRIAIGDRVSQAGLRMAAAAVR